MMSYETETRRQLVQEGLLEDSEQVGHNPIEWLSDAVEFDYGNFVIKFDGGIWYASHWDEDAFDEDIVIHSPQHGIEFSEGEIDLFGEHTLSLEEFGRLQQAVDNLFQ